MSYSYKCKNEKVKKWTTKNQKFENLNTTLKYYVDLGPKRYLGSCDPIIGSMGYGGGGSKLKVQGTDSYPVIECIYTCILFEQEISEMFNFDNKYKILRYIPTRRRNVTSRI